MGHLMVYEAKQTKQKEYDGMVYTYHILDHVRCCLLTYLLFFLFRWRFFI
jgi:hypothetical protein